MVCLELFVSFLLIGFTSFGGMSMIPLINSQMLAHGWMTLEEIADIVAVAEMTPGPLGLNCATFAGARVAGFWGALSASAGVLFPSFTLCLAAAAFIEKFKDNRLLRHSIYGIRPVCIGMIAGVVINLSLVNYSGDGFLGVSWTSLAIGGIAFALMRFAKLSVPKTILIAAALGLLTPLLGL